MSIYVLGLFFNGIFGAVFTIGNILDNILQSLVISPTIVVFWKTLILDQHNHLLSPFLNLENATTEKVIKWLELVPLQNQPYQVQILLLL